MIQVWNKLPTWSQWLTSVGGAIVLIYAAAVWGAEAIDQAIVTEGELGEVMKSLRVQKNQEKLMELNRDIVAERFANEAEKEFVLKEIEKLQKALKCDIENKCEK